MVKIRINLTFSTLRDLLIIVTFPAFCKKLFKFYFE